MGGGHTITRENAVKALFTKFPKTFHGEIHKGAKYTIELDSVEWFADLMMVCGDREETISETWELFHNELIIKLLKDRQRIDLHYDDIKHIIRALRNEEDKEMIIEALEERINHDIR